MLKCLFRIEQSLYHNTERVKQNNSPKIKYNFFLTKEKGS